jgi:thiamine-phosphate pyrophosphorylase
MCRHTNKDYLEKFFFFTDSINNEIINKILNFRNISIIYNSFNKNNNFEELNQIKNFCKKNNIKLYITNDLKLAIKIKADGLFLNNSYKKKLLISYKKNNFKIIAGVHSQKEYWLKAAEMFDDLIISPIYYNNKYSINQILGPIKFNLLTLDWEKRKYALGGINLNNLKKINLTKSYGVGFISLINNPQIKKPVCFNNKRAFKS